MSIPNIFGYSFVPQKNYSAFTVLYIINTQQSIIFKQQVPTLFKTEQEKSSRSSSLHLNMSLKTTYTMIDEMKLKMQTIEDSINRLNCLVNKSSNTNIKTTKCQPPAGNMPDLIQTVHVPSRGLARPKNKNKLERKIQKTIKKKLT